MGEFEELDDFANTCSCGVVIPWGEDTCDECRAEAGRAARISELMSTVEVARVQIQNGEAEIKRLGGSVDEPISDGEVEAFARAFMLEVPVSLTSARRAYVAGFNKAKEIYKH